MENANHVLLRGKPVCPGFVTGPVKIVRQTNDVEKVQEGDIMVVKNSNPAFAVGVMTSAGLICEVGGMLTHICIVSMEMGIPCLTQAERATEILKDGMMVTLNAAQGTVMHMS